MVTDIEELERLTHLKSTLEDSKQRKKARRKGVNT